MIITWYLLHHIVSALVVVALFSDSSLQISIYSYRNASLSKNACSLYTTTPNASQSRRRHVRVVRGPQQNLKSFGGLLHGRATQLEPPPPPQVQLQIAYEAHQAFSDFFLRFPAPQTCVRCTFYRFFHSFMVYWKRVTAIPNFPVNQPVIARGTWPGDDKLGFHFMK